MTEEDLMLLQAGGSTSGGVPQMNMEAPSPFMGAVPIDQQDPTRQYSSGGTDITDRPMETGGLDPYKQYAFDNTPDQYKQDISNYSGTQFRSPEQQQAFDANKAYSRDSNQIMRDSGERGRTGGRFGYMEGNPFSEMMAQVRQMRYDDDRDASTLKKQARQDTRAADQLAKAATSPRVRT
jgi:hypothetical protein